MTVAPGAAPTTTSAAQVPWDAGTESPTVRDAAPPTRPVVDAMEVSDRCVRVGQHIAEVLTQETTDPSQKAVYVQERARIVRRTAESCTRDAWTGKEIDCILAGKTQAALQSCRQPAAPAQRPPPTASDLPR
jgi:hypothetical protein